MPRTSEPWMAIIREHIQVPRYIQACASACLYDLLNGPSFVRIPWGNVQNFTDDDLATYYDDLVNDCVCECGDVIEETYTGQVGNAVRAFIDDELPGECWVDVDYGFYMDKEPETYYEEDGETFEYDLSNVYYLEKNQIVAAVFGATFAREFS